MSTSHRLRRAPALILCAAVLSIGLGGLASAPADAASKPSWTKNCTALNKKYPHGVGKAKAKDRDSAGRSVRKPVTNFTKSDKLYKTAIKWNKGLDRDKDGIACEKK